MACRLLGELLLPRVVRERVEALLSLRRLLLLGVTRIEGWRWGPLLLLLGRLRRQGPVGWQTRGLLGVEPGSGLRLSRSSGGGGGVGRGRTSLAGAEAILVRTGTLSRFERLSSSSGSSGGAAGDKGWSLSSVGREAGGRGAWCEGACAAGECGRGS